MQVINTNGFIADYDKQNIINTLLKETQLSKTLYNKEPISPESADHIATLATSVVEGMNISPISGSLIREIVNAVLLQEGMHEYRNLLQRVGMPVYDAYYIDVGTEGVGDNANLLRNPETFHKRKADQLAKEQALAMLPPHLAMLHQNADLHIHDLEYWTTRQFCIDSDARYFFYYGLDIGGSNVGTSVARPAKRAEVAALHLVKALSASQTNSAGGQGLLNFLTFMAPYFEGMDYDEIKQVIQLTIFEFTQMYVSRGGQTIFSSLQLTPGVPDLWLDIPIVYHGKVHDGVQAPLRTYREFEREVRLAYEAFMYLHLEGDARNRPFNFPKPEVAIQWEFMQEREWFDAGKYECMTYENLYLLTFRVASKFGTPYFDNMLPKYRQTSGIQCFQCCAFSFGANQETDTKYEDKLYFRNGEHFSLGGVQVLTLNFPRLAYKSGKDLNRFLQEAYRLFDHCAELFVLKRDQMKRLRSNRCMPFHQQRPLDPNTGGVGTELVEFDSQVYIIGLLGLNEVVQYLTGYQLHESEQAIKTALKICLAMKKYCHQLSKKHGFTMAFARTPAETTSQRFAVADLINPAYSEQAQEVVKGDLVYAMSHLNKKDLPVYYTNGTHISPDARIPITEKIRVEEKFFPVLDGGNICHIWLGEHAPDPRGLMDFTFNICKKTNLGYFSFTNDFTVRTGKHYRQYEP